MAGLELWSDCVGMGIEVSVVGGMCIVGTGVGEVSRMRSRVCPRVRSGLVH